MGHVALRVSGHSKFWWDLALVFLAEPVLVVCWFFAFFTMKDHLEATHQTLEPAVGVPWLHHLEASWCAGWVRW